MTLCVCGCLCFQTGKRIKKLAGHGSFVNSISSVSRGPDMVMSGSDDGTVKVRAACAAAA